MRTTLSIALVAASLGCTEPDEGTTSPAPQPRPTTSPDPTTPPEPTDPKPKPEPIPCSEDPDAPRGVNAYMCTPGFVLPTADGTLVELADYEGQIVLLEFVTMWCGVCRQSAPQIQAWSESRIDDGVAVITVIHEDVFSETPTVDDSEAWADEFEITHQVVADTEGEAKEAWNRGSTMPTPMTYILDEYGIIQFFAGGAESTDRYDEIVEGLLTD